MTKKLRITVGFTANEYDEQYDIFLRGEYLIEEDKIIFPPNIALYNPNDTTRHSALIFFNDVEYILNVKVNSESLLQHKLNFIIEKDDLYRKLISAVSASDLFGELSLKEDFSKKRIKL